MKNIYLILFIVGTFFFSCDKEKENKQMPPQQINVFEVKAQTVPIYEEFVGQIYGKKDIPVRARVDGYIEEIHFKEGSRVKKGDLLYVLDPAPFEESVVAKQSMVAQSETILVQTESDLKRIKPYL